MADAKKERHRRSEQLPADAAFVARGASSIPPCSPSPQQPTRRSTGSSGSPRPPRSVVSPGSTSLPRSSAAPTGACSSPPAHCWHPAWLSGRRADLSDLEPTGTACGRTHDQRRPRRGQRPRPGLDPPTTTTAGGSPPEGLYGRPKMTPLVRRSLPNATPGALDRAMRIP